MNWLGHLLKTLTQPPPASRPGRSKPRRRPAASRPPAAPARHAGPRTATGKCRTVTAYHGTPSLENARSILRHGWMVGSGNASGDGIYLALDRATAKSYAGHSGVYLQCRISGRICQWNAAIQAQYGAWCQARGVRQDNSARTAFLIQQGYEIQENGSVLVVLAPQMANPTAWKRKDRRIRIVGVYRAADDRRLRL